MANVLNSEPESITLNTELETPTLEPAAENEQPSPESTSKHDLAEAPTPEAVSTNTPDAENPSTPAAKTSSPLLHAEHTQAPAKLSDAESVISSESAEDFSAALEAFEREQAAEAAAVEAYGDKLVSSTVIKQTDKHLVVDVGLKSEGLIPLDQVTDHTGAVKFNPG